MQINVNGQNYSRWEDVPPEVRQQLAATLPDADKNGIPDLLEGNLSGLPTGAQTFASTSIMVNGQSVNSLDQLPPEVRNTLHQVFGWAAPVAGTTAPGAPQAPGMPATPPPAPTPPIQPGQVMLNGVPTTVEDATAAAKKPWWKRLFGG